MPPRQESIGNDLATDYLPLQGFVELNINVQKSVPVKLVSPFSHITMKY